MFKRIFWFIAVLFFLMIRTVSAQAHSSVITSSLINWDSLIFAGVPVTWSQQLTRVSCITDSGGVVKSMGGNNDGWDWTGFGISVQDGLESTVWGFLSQTQSYSRLYSNVDSFPAQTIAETARTGYFIAEETGELEVSFNYSFYDDIIIQSDELLVYGGSEVTLLFDFVDRIDHFLVTTSSSSLDFSVRGVNSSTWEMDEILSSIIYVIEGERIYFDASAMARSAMKLYEFSDSENFPVLDDGSEETYPPYWVDRNVVPEPTTIGLMMMGLLGLAAYKRKV